MMSILEVLSKILGEINIIFSLTRISEFGTYIFQVSFLKGNTLRITTLNLFLVNTRMGEVKVH